MKMPLRGRAARLANMLPARQNTAARTPFVLLVVVLLGSGLITLLLLNASLNQGSFQLSKLKKQTTELTDEQQALQQEVDAFSAPDALERRARELGMVPGGSPVFLGPDGRVRGMPSEAEADRASKRASRAARLPSARPQLSPTPDEPQTAHERRAPHEPGGPAPSAASPTPTPTPGR